MNHSRAISSAPGSTTSGLSSGDRAHSPQLSHGDWRLRIHGMVDREITYRLSDLALFDVVETVTILTGVSNPVGGNLISTSVWTGHRVADLLAVARAHTDVDMVLSTSIDGFTAGMPRRGNHRWP